MPAADFVRLANERLAPKPPTMARVVELNRGPLIEQEPDRALVADAARRGAAARRAARPPTSPPATSPARSRCPSRSPGFANRAGFVLDLDREVTVLARLAARRPTQAVRLLAAVGFARFSMLDRGLPEGAALETFRRHLRRRRSTRPELQVLDVREPDEQDDHRAGRALRPLPRARRRRPVGARPAAAGRHGLQLGRARLRSPRACSRAAASATSAPCSRAACPPTSRAAATPSAR